MFTKYSIGQIQSVEDKDHVEEREIDNGCMVDQKQYKLVICSKCKLQHMLVDSNEQKCCGEVLRIN